VNRNRLLASAALLLAAACGDGGTPARVATAVSVSPSVVELDAVGATRLVRAVVNDQDGQPLVGAAVTWASSSAAVTVASAGGDSAVVTSVGNGAATITATAGSASGSTTVQVAQVASTASAAGGDAQIAPVGTTLPGQLQVVVRDRLNAPMAGVAVTFLVSGGGAITANSAVTGANGVAAVGWTLGTNTRLSQQVLATVQGVGAVPFTATVLAGPAAASNLTAGNDQTATPGSAVAVTPTVIVRDSYNNPVPGVAVQFAVTRGGGSITGATQTTSATGEASVGQWTLGAAGPQSLTATFPGTSLAPVVFTATAGAAVQLSISGGDNQAALVTTAVPTAPSVLVRDMGGTPVAGVTVNFAITTGAGAVGSATATTNASGVASAGSWTMGGAGGPNRLTATVPGYAHTPVVFRGVGCEGGGAGYAMTLCFTTPMTASQRTAFTAAAAKWSSVITADLPDGGGAIGAGTCGAGSPSADMTYDDLVIFAGIEAIDGPGAVLGSAGPCYIRNTSALPLIGVMRFDVADVANLEASGSFGSVILHEMGHVVGVGTLWNYKGLLQNLSSTGSVLDTHYTGTNGRAGFDAVGGATYTGGQKAPVENTGGPGTANSHWRESVLNNELMTGYLNSGGSNPMSQLTVRSLIDLGYQVNVSAADAFSVSLSLRAEGDVARPQLRLHNDVYTGPLYMMDRGGRVTRIRN
jgi:hypothetical protein